MLLPYYSAGLPGCGGEIKSTPEDFEVEEIPSYLPSGSGEHLYLWLEKRGISTRHAIGLIGREMGLDKRRIGYAGLKDAQAVCRQWISLHTPAEPPEGLLEGSGLRVISSSRHGNKLRPGHLLGNRFRIVIRGAAEPPDFPLLISRIRDGGFPNYFGPQRLGRGCANALEGRRLLLDGLKGRGKLERNRFLVNAYQAALFNELVAVRLNETGEPGRILSGDLAVKHGSGGFFSVLPNELQQAIERAGQGEISPSAPLFGYKIPLAGERPGEWEQRLLDGEGITAATFKQGGKRNSPKGERRAVRAFPADLAWASTEKDGLPCLEVSFNLGAGVYATSLLRELMKNDDLGHFPLSGL